MAISPDHSVYPQELDLIEIPQDTPNTYLSQAEKTGEVNPRNIRNNSQNHRSMGDMLNTLQRYTPLEQNWAQSPVYSAPQSADKRGITTYDHGLRGSHTDFRGDINVNKAGPNVRPIYIDSNFIDYTHADPTLAPYDLNFANTNADDAIHKLCLKIKGLEDRIKEIEKVIHSFTVRGYTLRSFRGNSFTFWDNPCWLPGSYSPVPGQPTHGQGSFNDVESILFDNTASGDGSLLKWSGIVSFLFLTDFEPGDRDGYFQIQFSYKVNSSDGWSDWAVTPTYDPSDPNNFPSPPWWDNGSHPDELEECSFVTFGSGQPLGANFVNQPIMALRYRFVVAGRHLQNFYNPLSGHSVRQALSVYTDVRS